MGSEDHSIMLDGILNDASDSLDISEMTEMREEENNNNSDSDEDIDFDMIDSAFIEYGDDDNVIADDEEKDFLSDGWKWNQWEEIGDDEEVGGEVENDHYNGPHGLKIGVANKFKTVLECIFYCTAMSRDFFQRLAAQSNSYARQHMMARNTIVFLGHRWTNISTGEMIHFFGIMLHISLEPRKMGGYVSYFYSKPNIYLGSGYTVEPRGYDDWAMMS